MISNNQIPVDMKIYQDQNEQNKAQQNNVPVEDKNKGKSYLKGFIGAILGALIGAIPWAIVYYFGWFVGILGFVIGIASSKGYDIMRGKAGKGKIAIVIIASIIGVLAGNLIGDCITVGTMINNGEIEGAVMSDILNIILYSLFTSTEYLSSFFLSVGVGIIFIIIGLMGVFKKIAQESKQGKNNPTYQILK